MLLGGRAKRCIHPVIDARGRDAGYDFFRCSRVGRLSGSNQSELALFPYLRVIHTFRKNFLGDFCPMLDA